MSDQTVKEWAEEFIQTERLDEALLSELECAFGGNVPDKPIELVKTVMKESIVAAAEHWGKRFYADALSNNGWEPREKAEEMASDWWQSVKGQDDI